MDGDNLIMMEGISIDSDGIADAAVDFAAVKARAHDGGPVTEPIVREWLQEGVGKAIARFVLGGLDRMKERMKAMTRTPPLTPAEMEAHRRENARDKEELDRLIGSETDDSKLPTATVRRR